MISNCHIFRNMHPTVRNSPSTCHLHPAMFHHRKRFVADKSLLELGLHNSHIIEIWHVESGCNKIALKSTTRWLLSHPKHQDSRKERVYDSYGAAEYRQNSFGNQNSFIVGVFKSLHSVEQILPMGQEFAIPIALKHYHLGHGAVLSSPGPRRSIDCGSEWLDDLRWTYPISVGLGAPATRLLVPESYIMPGSPWRWY